MVETPDHALEAQISAELVKRIGQGDRRAEEDLVRRYQRGLTYLLKRRTRDPQLALDLAQETFRIAIEKLRQSPIEQVERVAGYLRGTALNLVSADIRKNVRRATTADSDAVDAAAGTARPRNLDQDVPRGSGQERYLRGPRRRLRPLQSSLVPRQAAVSRSADERCFTTRPTRGRLAERIGARGPL